MRRHRPDLIVPIRDRRRGKRYLTIRNVGAVTIVFIVLFAAITIRSEMRDKAPGERLWSDTVPEIQQRPVEVVREATPPIEDNTSADPMLLAPAAREQWLHDTSAAVATVPPVTPLDHGAARPQGADSSVTIVGGPDGVAVVRRDRQQPVLRGGFGRPTEN